MDGLFDGTPYEQIDDLGGKTPLILEGHPNGNPQDEGQGNQKLPGRPTVKPTIGSPLAVGFSTVKNWSSTDHFSQFNHASMKWMFLKVGFFYPPNHPFVHRVFHEINPSILGAHPYFWKHPNV